MPRSNLPALILFAAAALGIVLLTRTGRAEDGPYDLRFITLSGDGSSAKAWFEGAPPSGARVQEALDRFTKEGFRYAALQPTFRQGQVNVTTAPSASAPNTPEPTFVLLLERGRR